MSLFIINRYDEEEEPNDLDDENHRLRELKEKIEERRKARLKYVEKSTVEIEEEHDQIEDQDVTNVTHNKNENECDTNIPVDTIDVTQFKVLGVKDFEKNVKVKRVLPYWLANPVPIPIDLQECDISIENATFLDESLKKKMLQEGLSFLFPVQSKVIPWLLDEYKMSGAFWPRDVCVSAPTGSGKTLTYVLPIIQMLSNRVKRKTRALVILPVKELAIQVAKVFREYCIGTNLKVALLTGLVSFSQEQIQIVKFSETFGWQCEADIVVCTAGRLVEHLRNTKGFTLQGVQFLVLDEADRIMDHIQNDWLHHLNKHLMLKESKIIQSVSVLNSNTMFSSKRPPQKLLFSATLSQDPEKLKQWNLFQPKLFAVSQGSDSVEKFTTPLELSEKYTICKIDSKPLVLYEILKQENCKRVLCFTNSSQAAHRLTLLLSFLMKDEFFVAELSASLGRSSREAVLKQLQSGKLNMLISTDALSRGIDVPNCDLVISYDPPKNGKIYIHRVGRTGRAGRYGKAVTILQGNQYKVFQETLKVIGKQDIERFRIEEEILAQLSQKYKDAMQLFNSELKNESLVQTSNLKQRKRGRIANTAHSSSKQFKGNI